MGATKDFACVSCHLVHRARSKVRKFGDSLYCSKCYIKMKRIISTQSINEMDEASPHQEDPPEDPAEIVSGENEGETDGIELECDASGDCNIQDPEPPLKKVKLTFGRFKQSTSRCFMCNSSEKLRVVPYRAIARCFLECNKIIIHNTKCCSRHFNGDFLDHAALKSTEPDFEDTLMTEEVTRFISSLRDLAVLEMERNKGGLDLEDEDLSDQDYINLTGITKQNFDHILSVCREGEMYKSYERKPNLRKCIAVLLVKLRTNLSLAVLSTLFKADRSSISRMMKKGRKMLMESFVPMYLGTSHINHETFVNNHTRLFAQKLLNTEGEAIIIADATYCFIQKSGNYKFQRMTYSLHKYRVLVKIMILISSTGYILAVYGPYHANGKNNDANILVDLLKRDCHGLNEWLQPGDYLIVDRGFRDGLEFFKELGLNTRMPHFLPKNKAQHSTEESNESRIVTSMRWVIEAVNGMIKNWKALQTVFPNQEIPNIGDYVQIVCAICNAFRPPRVFDTSTDVRKAEDMLRRLDQINELHDIVKEKRFAAVRAVWEEISDASLTDFPRLSPQDLQDLTLGIYQLKQARSYTDEHHDDEGLYSLFYHRDQENIIRIKLQSRHTSSKVYSLWISYDERDQSVNGWYCQCKTGARTIGCCAHIASVLWYLGYDRYRENNEKRLSQNYHIHVSDVGQEQADREFMDNQGVFETLSADEEDSDSD